MFSKIPLFTAVVSAGKCPFGYDSSSNESVAEHPRVSSSSAQYPTEIFPCTAAGTGKGIATTATMDMAKY